MKQMIPEAKPRIPLIPSTSIPRLLCIDLFFIFILSKKKNQKKKTKTYKENKVAAPYACVRSIIDKNRNRPRNGRVRAVTERRLEEEEEKKKLNSSHWNKFIKERERERENKLN